MIEKAINVKAKTNLQPPSGTREIDSRCPKTYRPLIKKDKDDAYWEQRDKTSNRDKKKLSPTIRCLPLISLKPRSPTLRNAKKRVRRRLSSYWGVTPASKKITMQTSILTNQKTSGGLGDLYVDD